jgi:hypothetical protein
MTQTRLDPPKGKVKLLIDHTGSMTKMLVERREGGRVILRGELGRADVVTSNNRIYPRHILEREISRLQKEAKARKLLGELDHPCLTSDDFRVLTVDGWKPFREIKVGDKVWSRKNGKAVISVVTGIVDEPYDGLAYRISGRDIDSTFTPGHRLMLLRNPDQEDLSETYRTVEDVFLHRSDLRHSCIPKCAEWDAEPSDFVVIPGYQLDAKLFAAFMGVYLSEGSCIPSDGENCGIFISQKNPWLRKAIREEILDRFPFDLKWHEEEEGFYLSDALLYEYLNPLGNTYTRYVPSEVKSLDADCLREFIYWFLMGDGREISTVSVKSGEGWNVHDGSWRETGEGFKSSIATAIRGRTVPFTRRDVFSVSERLVRDIHECVVKAGGCGTISKIVTEEDYASSGHVIKAENKVPLYKLSISKSENIGLDPRFLNIEETHHKGNIFCLSVTHGNFYMEQNGHAFWTGNSDGRTQYQRASHKITDIRLEEDGRIMGEIEVIPTSKGKDLAALAESGVQIGFSSRGTGTTHKREDGVDVVNDDYHLITYDAVADPAHTGAYPEVFFESKELPELWRVEDMPQDTLDALIAKNPELGKELELRVREEIEKERVRMKAEAEEAVKAQVQSTLLQHLGEIRKEVEESLKSEMSTDPNLANLKRRLEAVKAALGVDGTGVSKEEFEKVQKALGERDEQIKILSQQVEDIRKKLSEAEAERDKVLLKAKKEAMERFIEKQANVSGNPSLFKKLIAGRVSESDSADSLKKTVENVLGIMKELKATEDRKAAQINDLSAKIKEEVDRQIADLKAKLEALEKRNANLEESNQRLRMAAEKSLLIAREGYTEALKRKIFEEKAGNHPARSKILTLLEQANVNKREEIERFIEEAIKGEKDSVLLEQVRSKVGKGEGGGTTEDGKERPSLLEQVRRGDQTLFGTPLSTLRKLAGIKG